MGRDLPPAKKGAYRGVQRGGFASWKKGKDGLTGRERARLAGRKGGLVSSMRRRHLVGTPPICEVFKTNGSKCYRPVVIEAIIPGTPYRRAICAVHRTRVRKLAQLDYRFQREEGYKMIGRDPATL